MSRSVGAVDAAQTVLSEEAALVLGLLTQLGDIWFLVTAVVLAYWLRPSDRERTAVVAGVTIATIALVEALKGLFDLPRPATPLATVDVYPAVLQELFEATATAGGPGFPSGHATLTTAVVLGLAGAVRMGPPRRRAGLAVGLIALVSFTRVALGVHFLVDVIVGMLLGLTVLTGTALAIRSAPTRAPTTALGLAVAVALAGLALATQSVDPSDAAFGPLAHDPFLAFTTALGAFAGWQAYLFCTANSGDDRQTASGQPHAGTDDSASVQRATAQALVAIGVGHVFLALGLAGAVVGDLTAAQGGMTGIAAALVIALPALVPGFDATIAGYVPRWLGGGSGGIEG